LTLKSIVLNDKTLRFLIVVTSPENPVQGFKSWAIGPFLAQISVDGVLNPSTYYPSSESKDEGVEMRYGYDNSGTLDPIPNGARQLTLIITSEGETPAHLEFHIPLD